MTAVTVTVECTGKGVYGPITALFFGSDPSAPEWADDTTSLNLNMTVPSATGAQFDQGSKYTLTFEPSA